MVRVIPGGSGCVKAGEAGGVVHFISEPAFLVLPIKSCTDVNITINK